MKDINKVKMFLKEYEKLCQKYKMGIEGCGCCGSPYIVINKLVVFENIKYKSADDKVYIDDKTIDEIIGDE